MAGITHCAFRELIAHFGGCSFFYTEMLNSRIVSTQNIESDPYCMVAKHDKPLIAQVAGNDPERVTSAFLRLKDTGLFYGYDFNLGCSKGSVVRYGWGSALLSNPKIVQDIITRVKELIDAPFFIKMRYPSPSSQWDIKKWAKLLEGSGIDAIIIHARTPEELFKRPSKWKRIKELKSMVSIPVIGNGDIFSPMDVERMITETECDGVMIGRSAIIRPWIFRDIVTYLKTGTIPDPPDPCHVIERYVEFLMKYLPESMRRSRFTVFASWFCQNFKFGLYFLKKALPEKSFPQIAFKLMEQLKGQSVKPYPCTPGLINV
jgi:nifR3 family TIM-barrel protein